MIHLYLLICISDIDHVSTQRIMFQFGIISMAGIKMLALSKIFMERMEVLLKEQLGGAPVWHLSAHCAPMRIVLSIFACYPTIRSRYVLVCHIHLAQLSPIIPTNGTSIWHPAAIRCH